MKISYNWLKDYLDFQETPEVLGEILTQTGLEVESIAYTGAVEGGLQGVVVGEVVRCEKHPEADKLKLTLVDVGSEELPIVCGASNVAIGQKVLVATVGTTLYPSTGDSLTIKAVKIRGEASLGMICAEDELGIGNSHDGIMVLPQSTPIGISAAHALELEQDAIFEIGLTPNRCDAMSHIGVARDIRAFLKHHKGIDLPIQWPEVSEIQNAMDSNRDIKLGNPEACSQYMLGEIKGVKVTTSPNWLQKKLMALGISPVNNVVDCTNFVMHEMGNPMHAFDAKFFQHSLSVRFAKEGESLCTLDGKVRSLKSNDLIIDGDGIPRCLAGIMGGNEAKVDESTTDLLLEAAYFDPSTIRKSSKQHGIHTDASFRFERGVDPSRIEHALRRLMHLIVTVAGGNPQGIRVIEQQPILKKEINLTHEAVNQFLGSTLDEKAFESILLSLDLIKKGASLWEIPAYRADVTRPVDVIEEVVRIIGFDAIPTDEKWHFSVPNTETFSAHGTRIKISTQLAAKGYHEVLNNSLTKSSYQNAITAKGNGSPIFLKNPLSQDLAMLRNSMAFGVLENIQYNKNRQAPNVKFFEFGHTYHQFGNQMVEREVLALGMTGVHNPESWIGSRPLSFYDLKSDVLSILALLNPNTLEEIPFETMDLYAEGIEIKVDGKSMARLGLLSPSSIKAFDLKTTVFFAEIDWKTYIERTKLATNVFESLPKTMAVRRDFAFLLDEEVSFSALKKTSFKAASNRLLSMHLFDVYEGEKLEKGKKSYALSFHFRDNEKTLTDAEIDAEMKCIHDAIVASFGAKLR
jgi:phenylalanyl-tRNA synthetase beta chain